jgi:hypothetical protein
MIHAFHSLYSMQQHLGLWLLVSDVPAAAPVIYLDSSE